MGSRQARSECAADPPHSTHMAHSRQSQTGKPLGDSRCSTPSHTSLNAIRCHLSDCGARTKQIFFDLANSSEPSGRTWSYSLAPRISEP